MCEDPRLPHTVCPIRLPANLADACATIHFDPGEADWLPVRFCRTELADDLLASCPSAVAEWPSEFDHAIPADRIAAALSWILDADSSRRRQYTTGATVTVKIPVSAPKPLPTPARRAGAHAYWELRQPIGCLVRPLFLRPPLNDMLYTYQRTGVRWLLETSAAVLADDMGLGKTIQAIAAVRILFHEGRVRSVLVICPRSLLANWESELRRWAPELTRLRVVPSGSEREEVWSEINGHVHVMLTNYEQLRERPDALTSRGVDLVLADEAHRIRNLSASVTQGVRRVPRSQFWALTGTPIERDAEDLATLLSTIEPTRFAPSDGELDADVLRARARPYVLRRHKEDVLSDLPDVIESTESIELLPAQRRAYRRALAGARDQRSREPKNVLALINELRTICDYDPASGKSAKIERIAELMADIAAAQEKVVVFSYLLQPLHLLQDRLRDVLGSSGTVIFEGQMDLEKREDALDRFRHDPTVVALLASSRAAGEGLTLTQANHVVFVNEWWNPSANAQARDRVVRIGQRKVVHVSKFVCRDTIDETLQRILERKGHTFAEVVGRLASPAGIDPESATVLTDIAQELDQSRP